MSTITARENTQSTFTPEVTAILTLAILCGVLLLTIAVWSVVRRCQTWRRARASQRANEGNELNTIERGQAAVDEAAAPSNTFNRRADEVKTRPTWEEELRLYRSMQKRGQTHIPRDDPTPISPRSNPFSMKTQAKPELDIADEGQGRSRRNADPDLPVYIGPLRDEPEEYDESRYSGVGRPSTAQAIPIVKVASKLRPVEVRAGVDHTPRRATISYSP
ncbi:hypothetical protein F4805DRAFT_455562 [Annulohypoxylon moriforme]|nr:hypothetical protein F4805DRAFT_455562 [Annulohypoxylon moriforme]